MSENKSIIKTEGKSRQFYIELFFALIIAGVACAAGLSNLLFSSNDFYPIAADVMGHMAKVQYITECLKEGFVPSWFPYWYNGATVAQYYPPLPYYLMVPIFALVKNVVLTYKINCFLMMFIGGMGIWFFCRKRIGKWCGLIGIVFYCLQPFLLGSLYGAGVIAQGPIYAMTPWLIYLVLSLCKEPSRYKVILCTIIVSLMILSHAMHAFIIVLCIMLVLLLVVLLKRISALNYMVVAISIVFSAFLTAFWSVIGVTGLENPTIPYILPGVAENVTATIEWFQPQYMGEFIFYFALPIIVFSIIAALALILRISKKQGSNEEKYEIAFCIILTFVTIVFSFGKEIPGFKFIPMHDSLVPGRILTLTAASAAIACAYLLFLTARVISRIQVFFRIVLTVVALSAITLTIYHINPYKFYFHVTSYEKYEKRFETVKDVPEAPFDKGRYAWFSGFGSDEASVPITYGFNLADGWNMEGSTHNRALWNHLSCIATDTNDYMAKNFAFWNVRYLTIYPEYDAIMPPLQEHLGFRLAYSNEFHASQLPSSYFLTDKRNALIFGIGAPGVAMEFPYLVHEQREDISDYSLNELLKYKLIYLCEPKVDTLRQKASIEKIIENLVNNGVYVIIEPTVTKGYKLFDVATSDVFFEDSPLLKKQPTSEIESMIENIELDDKYMYARVLFGLDKAYYKLDQNGGLLQNDVIGTKKVGDGEVLFLGLHLSQYLKAVHARNWGVPKNEQGYPACTDEVETLMGDIFKTLGAEQDFWPDPFPISSAEWDYKGVGFDYTAQGSEEMTLSVTYTPRWQATLDGEPLEVGQRENLATLELPAGEHRVRLIWTNKYGIMGYIISFFGLIILIFFIVKYEACNDYLKKFGIFFKKSLHL